ncbi:hypothetical protein ACL02T_21640 [Pseudonocardia sp. RS010]|uniref:hypothetical protein n=1 Tax=Pseudonocardia sp. RS010 TaxID=3385979 RepID=UPI00399F048E
MAPRRSPASSPLSGTPLAGRYPASVAMALLALAPFIVLSTATTLLDDDLATDLDASRYGLPLAGALSNATYAFGAVAAAATLLPFAGVAWLNRGSFTSPGFLVPLVLGLAALVTLVVRQYRKREALMPVTVIAHTLPGTGSGWRWSWAPPSPRRSRWPRSISGPVPQAVRAAGAVADSAA